jgi:hypothetical protein
MVPDGKNPIQSFSAWRGLMKLTLVLLFVLITTACTGGSKEKAEVKPASQTWALPEAVTAYCDIERKLATATSGLPIINGYRLTVDERKQLGTNNFTTHINALQSAAQELTELASRAPEDIRRFLDGRRSDLTKNRDVYSQSLPRIAAAVSMSDFDAANSENRPRLNADYRHVGQDLSKEAASLLAGMAQRNECGFYARHVLPQEGNLEGLSSPLTYASTCAACGLRWSATSADVTRDKVVVRISLSNTGERGNLDPSNVMPRLYLFNKTQADAVQSSVASGGTPASTPTTGSALFNAYVKAGYGLQFLYPAGPPLPVRLAPGETWSGDFETVAGIPLGTAGAIFYLGTFLPEKASTDALNLTFSVFSGSAARPLIPVSPN